MTARPQPLKSLPPYPVRPYAAGRFAASAGARGPKGGGRQAVHAALHPALRPDAKNRTAS